MIGNKIEFVWYGDKYSNNKEPKNYIGIVVDAFTNVSGRISGSSDVFLGFGGGKTSGSTENKRMYKVEFYEDWDTQKKCVQYKDIHDWQLKKIISFSGQTNQEVNEEKFQMG